MRAADRAVFDIDTALQVRENVLRNALTEITPQVVTDTYSKLGRLFDLVTEAMRFRWREFTNPANGVKGIAEESNMPQVMPIREWLERAKDECAEMRYTGHTAEQLAEICKAVGGRSREGHAHS